MQGESHSEQHQQIATTARDPHERPCKIIAQSGNWLQQRLILVRPVMENLIAPVGSIKRTMKQGIVPAKKAPPLTA